LATLGKALTERVGINLRISALLTRQMGAGGEWASVFYDSSDLCREREWLQPLGSQNPGIDGFVGNWARTEITNGDLGAGVLLRERRVEVVAHVGYQLAVAGMVGALKPDDSPVEHGIMLLNISKKVQLGH